MIHGCGWSKGLTVATDERIARRGEAIARGAGSKVVAHVRANTPDGSHRDDLAGDR